MQRAKWTVDSNQCLRGSCLAMLVWAPWTGSTPAMFVALIFDLKKAWLAVFNLAQFVPSGGMQMSVLSAVSGLPPWISDIVLMLDR